MTPDLHSFADIHCHTSVGPDRITSVEPGYEISTEQGSAWYSVGIHPWSTDKPVEETTFAALEQMANDERVVAIGECGIDALRGGDAQTQEQVFERQIEIAEKVGKPLIIHCVRRIGKLLEIRKRHPQGVWILHGFRGKPETARQLAAAEIGISLNTLRGENFQLPGVPERLLYRETDK